MDKENVYHKITPKQQNFIVYSYGLLVCIFNKICLNQINRTLFFKWEILALLLLRPTYGFFRGTNAVKYLEDIF